MNPNISLRDYFAGQALAAFISLETKHSPEEIASAAYKYADAMIAEKESTEEMEPLEITITNNLLSQ